METVSRPKRQEGTTLWFIKLILGPLIILLLGLHFIVNHLVASGGLLTWQDVVRYYQNPIIPGIEVVFLITVVCHSVLGLRSILLDLKPTEKVMRFVDPALILFSFVAIGYGIWLVSVVVSFG